MGKPIINILLLFHFRIACGDLKGVDKESKYLATLFITTLMKICNALVLYKYVRYVKID